MKRLTTSDGKVEPRRDFDQPSATTQRIVHAGRQDHHVVITWNLRSAGWPGRIVGGVLMLALLVWAAIFSVLLALLLAGAVVVAAALVILAVWKAKRARLRSEEEFTFQGGNKEPARTAAEPPGEIPRE